MTAAFSASLTLCKQAAPGLAWQGPDGSGGASAPALLSQQARESRLRDGGPPGPLHPAQEESSSLVGRGGEGGGGVENLAGDSNGAFGPKLFHSMIFQLSVQRESPLQIHLVL